MVGAAVSNRQYCGEETNITRKLTKFLFWGFLLLYLIALLLFAIGTFGLFGHESGPLAGVFLMPLGLPWNRLWKFLPVVTGPLLAVAALLVNLALLGRLAHSCSAVRSSSRGDDD